MPLESGTLIPDLDANNPLGSDPKSEGDDHLRLIKRTVLGTFPAFVGTTAVPKTVALSEDQINDAGLQNRANTWALLNTFNTQLRMGNNIAISSRNGALTLELKIAQIDNADVLTIGQDTEISELDIRALGSVSLFTAGEGIAGIRIIPAINGGALVVTKGGSTRQVGFRGAGPFDIASGLTLRQDHESNTIFATGAAQGFSAPQLEIGTTIRIVTEFSATGTLVTAGAGVTIRTHQGGSQFGGNIAIAASSVCELVWRSSTEVRAWGNGLTPAP